MGHHHKEKCWREDPCRKHKHHRHHRKCCREECFMGGESFAIFLILILLLLSGMNGV